MRKKEENSERIITFRQKQRIVWLSMRLLDREICALNLFSDFSLGFYKRNVIVYRNKSIFSMVVMRSAGGQQYANLVQIFIALRLPAFGMNILSAAG
jgi:hypothetical protein